MFARVDADIFVNLLHVTEIRKQADGSLRVFFANDENLPVPEDRAVDFMKRVNTINQAVARLASGNF